MSIPLKLSVWPFRAHQVRWVHGALGHRPLHLLIGSASEVGFSWSVWEGREDRGLRHGPPPLPCLVHR